MRPVPTAPPASIPALAFVAALILIPAATVLAGGSGEPPVDDYRDELPPVTRRYVESEEAERYDELLAEFDGRKELPEGYELQALIALSHFPELRQVRIRFVQDDVAIPISSRPRPVSAFRSRWNRLYLVVIDTETDGPRDTLLLRTQPFNAQIGILGHELAHTASYVHRTFFGIVADAVCQLSRPCRVRFERATDRRLIEHHLGWQRYDHSSFVRAGFREAGVESDGGGGAYMDPPELLEVMARSGHYDVDAAR